MSHKVSPVERDLGFVLDSGTLQGLSRRENEVVVLVYDGIAGLGSVSVILNLKGCKN